MELICLYVFIAIMGGAIGYCLAKLLIFFLDIPGKSGNSLGDYVGNFIEEMGGRFYEWCERHLPW